MKTIQSIWYDKHIGQNNAIHYNVYTVGEMYPMLGGNLVKLLSIEKKLDMFVLSFEKGWEYHVPLQDDTSIVYKDEDADTQDKTK